MSKELLTELLDGIEGAWSACSSHCLRARVERGHLPAVPPRARTHG